jgi:prepilin-type processing-associated H-X9-DG protein
MQFELARTRGQNVRGPLTKHFAALILFAKGLCPLSIGHTVLILEFGNTLLARLPSSCHMKANGAFTLRDFLPLIAMTYLLIFFFLPSASRTQSTTSAARCMANMRYLTVAWQLYVEENSGKLVENYDGADAQGGAIASRSRSSAPWACGWEDWTTSSDNTNTLFLRDIRFAKLSPYYQTRSNIHKCPADPFLSQAQWSRGWTARARSVSMNATVGLPQAKGPFDAAIYKVARRVSDLNNPGPAETYLFLDEHPDSINDPLFWPPSASGWVDLPGNFHSGGATISFADGHSEIHRWLGGLRSAPVRIGGFSSVARPGDSDVHWVSLHSQRVGQESH